MVTFGEQWTPLVAQLVKNLPAMWETWVQSLNWESPGEGNRATHSSILAWRIPWTIYSPWGHKELDMTEQLSLSFIIKALLSQWSWDNHPPYLWTCSATWRLHEPCCSGALREGGMVDKIIGYGVLTQSLASFPPRRPRGGAEKFQ